jgi:xanthine/uracil permease
LAIYGGRLNVNLPKKVTSYALNAGLPQSSINSLLVQLANGTSAAYTQVPGTNSDIIAAIGAGTKSAYAASFSTVYLSSLAFGGVALIASFFVTDIEKYMTSFVNKKVDGKSMHADLSKSKEIIDE